MHDIWEFTAAAPRPDELDEIDAALADLLALQGRRSTYWDADLADLTVTDPDEAAWYGEHEFEDGWDDPAEAAAILDQTMIDDARLTHWADTPTVRPVVRSVDDALIDAPTPEEELHETLKVFTLDAAAFTEEAWSGQEAA